MEKKLKLADVAAVAGVSTYTVSRALSGKAGVSLRTRRRVREIARRMGYSANVAASLLALQRGRRKGMKKFLVALGYWHEDNLRVCRDAGARVGVDVLGWRAGEFHSPQEAGRVLWQRGVGGLLLDVDFFIKTGWDVHEMGLERFSLCKTSRGLQQVSSHLVRHSAFDYMSLALRQVVAHGYTRVAILMPRSVSDQDDDARFGAFRAYQQRHKPRGVRMMWCDVEGRIDEKPSLRTLRTLESFEPDAILGYHWLQHGWLSRSGWLKPGRAGFAAVLAHSQPISGFPAVTGCDVQEHQVYERALRLLAEMMARGERGQTQRVLEQVIEPIWHEGATLGYKHAGEKERRRLTMLSQSAAARKIT